MFDKSEKTVDRGTAPHFLNTVWCKMHSSEGVGLNPAAVNI